MMELKNKKRIVVAFTGGGTGGHIYPGLAVADELRKVARTGDMQLCIYWIGSSNSMDRKIVENAVAADGIRSADKFYAVPSGKLRRYFSLKNVVDIFKIMGGFLVSYFLLRRLKPAILFSKGGFVSVPPCFGAKLLHIPVFTHECDFTPGLATKINSRVANRILVSYRETEKYFAPTYRSKIVVTGNPVRPAFYKADKQRGKKFLSIDDRTDGKPILLVIGGSSGARQINKLVEENIEWLCDHFIVVHQTGVDNEVHSENKNISVLIQRNAYKPYPFIYNEMPDVIASADVVLSRAGANSVWECAVLRKPLVLIPLSGSSTRGDQVDNAVFFEKNNAAAVLKGTDVTSENLRAVLSRFEKEEVRLTYGTAIGTLTEGKRPAERIADLLYTSITGDRNDIRAD